MDRYWLILQEKYQKIATKVNQVVLRERILLLLVLLVTIYIFWVLVFIFPYDKKVNLMKIEEASLLQQVAQMQQMVAEIEVNMSKVSLDAKTSPMLSGNELTPRQNVVTIFRSLVSKQPGITLQGLENLPDKFLQLTGNNEKSVAIPILLYEQGVKLTFSGDYLSVYDYLRALETLKWMIFWDELHYKVTQYPMAEISLLLHTVSRDRED